MCATAGSEAFSVWLLQDSRQKVKNTHLCSEKPNPRSVVLPAASDYLPGPFTQPLLLFTGCLLSVCQNDSICMSQKLLSHYQSEFIEGVSETPLDIILLMAHTPTHTIKWC